MITDQQYVSAGAGSPAEYAPTVYVRTRTQFTGSDCELWKPIAGLEERYEISNFGKIRSIPRPYKPELCNYVPPAKILKTAICGKGHEKLTVLFYGKPVSVRINRAVATAFVPNPLNLPYVHHKDRNKLNNRAENLEWSNRRLKAARKEGASHV